MKKFFTMMMAVLALLMTVASCSKDEPEVVTVSDVTLNKSAIALIVGHTEILTATVAPDNAEDKTLTWTSSLPAVATVDNGLVTARTKGTTLITVTSASGKTATCEVSVEFLVPTVLIPKGRFMMGSSSGAAVGTGTPDVDVNATPREPNRWDNEMQHWVTLTQDYYMSQYEITNAQYAAFLNDAGVDGSAANDAIQDGQILIEESTANNESWGNVDWGLHYTNNQWVPVAGYENHPVINVTWYGAKAYALWAGGDLPTEAQWERAARAGRENRPFGVGEGWTITGDMANFNGMGAYDFNNGGGYTDPNGLYVGSTTVGGSYAPNAYGVYDMHGNVAEWCDDWWIEYANYPTTIDPVSPDDDGLGKVQRGVFWGHGGAFCRTAFRGGTYADVTGPGTGVRIVFRAAQ
jgi:formylglycine-generating enzyme required for sulfatase activity